MRGMPYPAKTIARFFWVRDQRIGNATAKAVLTALAAYDMPNGNGIFPSQSTLAADTELTTRGVRRAIKFLHASGWITVKPGPKSGKGRYVVNAYAIHRPEERGSYGPEERRSA